VPLSVIPLLKALALIIVVELIERELEYKVEEDEGSEPSVVYLILAPTVLQVSSTFWDEE
jgi:hypothetical protein